MSRISSGISSLFVGAALAAFFAWCWAYIAAYSPLPSLVLGSGLRGAGFSAAITAADFLVSVGLCVPGAWLLMRLGREQTRTNTLLAVAAFAAVAALTMGLPVFSHGALVVAQYALQLAALPAAVLLLAGSHRSAPNNSSKPTPLRGAA
ncbi:hypothetical protein ACFFGH_34480 [Lysobacter korlensis]|uniref:Uncharacterized protein n=1 Tax=Lysobacter korlensis TaxID=553636 RepID=A0ABV6S158_9GAMM